MELALLYVRGGQARGRRDLLHQAGGDPRRGDRGALPHAATTRASLTRRSCRSRTSHRPRATRGARRHRGVDGGPGRAQGDAHRPEARRAGRSARARERQRAARVPREAAASGRREERLEQLQERLRLPTLPRRIECCDISHLGGGDTVGRDRRDEGRPARQEALPDVPRARYGRAAREAGDDYAAMYEVLARRFRRSVGTKADGPPGDARATEAEGAGEPGATMSEAEATRRGTASTGSSRISSSSTAGEGSSTSRSRRRTISGCTSCRSSALAKEKENVAGRDARRPRLPPRPEEPDPR